MRYDNNDLRRGLPAYRSSPRPDETTFATSADSTISFPNPPCYSPAPSYRSRSRSSSSSIDGNSLTPPSSDTGDSWSDVNESESGMDAAVAIANAQHHMYAPPYPRDRSREEDLVRPPVEALRSGTRPVAQTLASARTIVLSSIPYGRRSRQSPRERDVEYSARERSGWKATCIGIAICVFLIIGMILAVALAIICRDSKKELHSAEAGGGVEDMSWDGETEMGWWG